MKTKIVFSTSKLQHKVVETSHIVNHICLDCGEIVFVDSSNFGIKKEDLKKHEGHKVFIRHDLNDFTIVEVGWKK